MSAIEKTAELTVRPITGAGGAEVWGFDIVGADAASCARINALMLQYGVLAVHGQAHATTEDLRAFGKQFGKLDVHGFSPTVGEHQDVMKIGQLSEAWHSDVSWKEVPPKYSMLLGRQVPSLGGDTLFANQYQAYRDLSAPIKTLMDSLDAIHDGRQFDPDLIRHPVTHPVVIRHPETGRQALYVNRNFTQRIKDLQATESRSLLEFLFAHCSRATYHTRVRYEAGTLAIWDNRCMQHSPCHDYDNSETRSMERVTVLCEERPKR